MDGNHHQYSNMMDGQDGLGEDGLGEDGFDPNYIIAGQDALYRDDQASDQPYALCRFQNDDTDEPWHPNNIASGNSKEAHTGSGKEAHPRDESTKESKGSKGSADPKDPKVNKELKKNKKTKANKGDGKNDTKGHSRKPRKDDGSKKKHHGQKERNYHGQAA
ncbi:hypothetical protein GE09DRAFT_1254572 [Coniochaeta sp. 2T2.1]|nr:hypothetical protein GE09DRAFT_1254572 [Coniochaeta sp. 2T2.1]